MAHEIQEPKLGSSQLILQQVEQVQRPQQPPKDPRRCFAPTQGWS